MVVVEAGKLGLGLFIGAKVGSPTARSFLRRKIFCPRGHVFGWSGGELVARYGSCSSSCGQSEVGAKAVSWRHARVSMGFAEGIGMARKGTRERGGSQVGLILSCFGGAAA
jgi:hypothetical protein